MLTDVEKGELVDFITIMFPKEESTGRAEMMFKIMKTDKWTVEQFHDVLNEFFYIWKYSTWMPANFFEIYEDLFGKVKIDPRNIGRVIPGVEETAKILNRILPKEEVFNQFKDLKIGTIFEFTDYEDSRQTGKKINDEDYTVNGRTYFYTLLNNIKLTISKDSDVEQKES